MEIIFKTECTHNDYKDMLQLWNGEKGRIYPYNMASFDFNVIDYPEKQAMAAFDSESGIMLGFIILKEFHNDYLTGYNDSLFIHLFYVSKKARHQGIGSKFIEFADEVANGREIWVGKEIGNFAPGVPYEFDNLTDAFLKKRGYTIGRYTHDLVYRNPKKQELTNKEITYQFCTEEKLPEMIEFIERNGWKRWAYEAIEEFKHKKDNTCYVIGLDKGKVISFAKANNLDNGENSYNMMWKDRFKNLGGIGPLGVDKEYRKMHLGGDVVKAAINALVDYGVSDIMIDWTGLLEFYEKYGFELYKAYFYVHKDKVVKEEVDN